MMRPFLLAMLIGMCLLVASSNERAPATAQSTKTKAVLNETERAMVSGSRAEIVRTGMSSRYFDRHFTLVKVVNQPSDRRVVWKFSVNGYSTTVTDVLGYYTKDGKRIDTHSATAELRATSDINRTISRRKAHQIMQQCIGNFRNAVVEYRSVDAKAARLFLTAESSPRMSRRDEEREREEREREERAARERQAKTNSSSADALEEEGEERKPIKVGSVDLQTGKCIKGELQVTPFR